MAKAPIRPPDVELSLPMMAFCTVLERDSSTTRSKGLSCASSRLPKTRSATTRKTYTSTGRRIFSAIGAPTTKISPHIFDEASHSGIPCPPQVKLPQFSPKQNRGFVVLVYFGFGVRRKSCEKAVDDFARGGPTDDGRRVVVDRKSTRLNSSHANISYAV